MLIGYARVSTGDQNLDLQKNALIRAECELVFEDTASGKNARRPGLKRALRRLRPGDVLVVWKLDRLGRSVRDLITLVSELQARGVNFRSLTDSIDTSTPAGRFFFPRHERPGGNGARADRRAYPRRFSRCEGAGESRWPPPGND
ncbi:recombinase family protein [Klebsiella pneumoniae]|nr:recombinase family protein [Klebsiella pneumoniae]MDA4027125.1 recombinase family protein [Klebsiella pneumoniae]